MWCNYGYCAAAKLAWAGSGASGSGTGRSGHRPQWWRHRVWDESQHQPRVWSIPHITLLFSFSTSSCLLVSHPSPFPTLQLTRQGFGPGSAKPLYVCVCTSVCMCLDFDFVYILCHLCLSNMHILYTGGENAWRPHNTVLSQLLFCLWATGGLVVGQPLWSEGCGLKSHHWGTLKVPSPHTTPLCFWLPVCSRMTLYTYTLHSHLGEI